MESAVAVSFMYPTCIIKRDGRQVDYNKKKIAEAVHKSIRHTGRVDRALAESVADSVTESLSGNTMPTVEEIQDAVERELIARNEADIAKKYILYRAERSRVRDGKSGLMDSVGDILKETSKDNANVAGGPSAKMLQIASAASRQFYLSRLIPEKISALHRNGDIHIHDMDFYSKTVNCLQIPLDKLLAEGFNAGHGFIRSPKRIGSAAALSCILLQSNQNDCFGGQGFAHYDYDMAPYAAKAASEDEIFQAMESVIYNLNSMHSRAGAQVPFSSLNFGTDTSDAGVAISRNLLKAYEKGLGRGENPIFPNLIFRVKKGINQFPGDPNYDLYQLALHVASERLNPTFSFMDSSFNSQYGEEVSYMGCRTRVMSNRHGEEKATGRGNLSFTTVNLPRLAIDSRGNTEHFFDMLDSICEVVGWQLHHRFKIQAVLTAKDIPFLIGQKLYMGSERLGPNDSIEPAIKNGTLSIGYIGLAEALTALVGEHHGQSKDSQRLGLEIIARLRENCDKLSDLYDLNYSLIGTPAEGLSGRFLNIDKRKYGVIPGVTDKEYYTNSNHVPVDYEISAFEKVRIEAPYHKFCNAGHISYIELPSAPANNVASMEQLVNFMGENDMGYAGINFPLDFCDDCGFMGLISDKCQCGSTDILRVRRITGYLSTVDRFNDAKVAELRARTRNPHMRT